MSKVISYFLFIILEGGTLMILMVVLTYYKVGVNEKQTRKLPQLKRKFGNKQKLEQLYERIILLFNTTCYN